jgi:sigma-B regulation protein RsbU (phosphoserine phosphatase)
MTTHPSSSIWLKVLWAAGALLAIALLVQTVMNYRYVANSLLLQHARRVADERVRNIERAARLTPPRDAAALQALLDDLRSEMADQVAALAVFQPDGTTVARSGGGSAVAASDRGRRFQPDREIPLTQESRAGRQIIVGAFPCRCGPPRQAAVAATAPPPPGRLLLEVALYRDGLSAPFARLRRNATISASAALTLLVALSLIALRFGPYVRGKQLEGQMDLARQVQQDLLPGRATLPAGIDAAAECLPAWQVGGDFYDIVSLPDGRVSFVVGDVSGHGIAAALLMGLIHGAMSSPRWGASNHDPETAAAHLNELLLTKSSAGRFASMFWCSYDPVSGALRYLNAGHLPGLLMRRTPVGTWDIERLTEGGPVLGVLGDATYRTASVDTHEHDLLALFSDGISEATNHGGDYFGEEGVTAVLQHNPGLPAAATCAAILSAVQSFTGGRPPQDDQTLLIVRLWRAADRSVA